MELYPGLAPARAVIIQKFSNRALRIIQLPRLGHGQATELDGPIALAEGRDGIVVRIVTREFVRRATLQMQFQLALFRFGDDDGLLRQRQA